MHRVSPAPREKMEYKITVERLEPPEEGSKYSSSTSVYEQIIEELNVEAVIKAANELE